MHTYRARFVTPVSQRGAALGFAIGATAFISAVTVTTVLAYRAESSATSYRGVSIPDPLVVATAVTQAGVTPEALAVAGLTAAEATTVISEAVLQSESRLTELRTSMQNIESARDALQAAENDSSSSDTQLAALRQALDDAVDTRSQLIGLIRTPALSSLDTGDQRRFDNYHAASQGSLPAVLTAKDWPAQDVARLSAVCRRLSAAAARGEPDPDAQAEYDQALADPDVAVANASYDQRLAAIQAAWDAALAPGA